MNERQRPTTKPHTFNFRASEEQVELINRIIDNLGLDTKTEAFEHLCEVYKHALKVIHNK